LFSKPSTYEAYLCQIIWLSLFTRHLAYSLREKQQRTTGGRYFG